MKLYSGTTSKNNPLAIFFFSLVYLLCMRALICVYGVISVNFLKITEKMWKTLFEEYVRSWILAAQVKSDSQTQHPVCHVSALCTFSVSCLSLPGAFNNEATA